MIKAGKSPSTRLIVSTTVATTYITKDQRQDLIDRYMECWFDTESFSIEEAAEDEGLELRAEFESMNNSQLMAEIKASGWSFRGIDY